MSAREFAVTFAEALEDFVKNFWVIIAGLVLGKLIGISLFTHLIVKMKITSLPKGVGFRQVYGAALLAGIGFTMSIFISDLAFSDEKSIQIAKVGVFAASILPAVVR